MRKSQVHIMVIDDMSVSRGLMQQFLEGLGFTKVIYESDGVSALNKLKETQVHLVLSDMNMPVMDGLSVLKELRGQKTTAGVGFILITGQATSEIMEKGKALGMNNFLKKPYTAKDLLSTIEAVTGRLD